MMIQIVFWGLVLAILYHHAIYPLLLRLIAATVRRVRPATARRLGQDEALPDLAIVMAAYNEAPFIAAKIADLAAARYPGGTVRIVIGCDGSSDGTAEIAAKAIAELQVCPHVFDIHRFEDNRGKVAVINDLIGMCSAPIVALTDVSAAISRDTLEEVARLFVSPRIGVVCPAYVLQSEGSIGEGRYWRYQRAIRIDEATLGSPMGAHGAFYAFRRSLWTPLPADTINDDFVLPMTIVANGALGLYAADIACVERERTQISQEFMRRIRIGAGNFQQAIRLWRLADPRRPGLAFAFISGKGLRAFMPLILLAALLLNVLLAIGSGGPYPALLLCQICGYGLAALSPFLLEAKLGGPFLRKPVAWLAYLVRGYLAGLIGIVRPSLSRRSFRSAGTSADPDDYIHPLTFIGKRALDIAIGLCVLLVLAVIFLPIALLIKLDSRGPILYRQIRVGRRTSKQTDLFYITKFRTMRSDAEKTTGAVWSRGTGDPRITRLGHFLRKTRIDELPQALSVLKGEMSIVGPRPERPAFFPKLEAEIPFYAERTFSIKPGITGLAQVNHGYDSSIEDVRTKVLYDHTYAMRIAKPLGWLKTDFSIIVKTLTVMATGKGQ